MLKLAFAKLLNSPSKKSPFDNLDMSDLEKFSGLIGGSQVQMQSFETGTPEPDPIDVQAAAKPEAFDVQAADSLVEAIGRCDAELSDIDLQERQLEDLLILIRNHKGRVILTRAGYSKALGHINSTRLDEVVASIDAPDLALDVVKPRSRRKASN